MEIEFCTHTHTHQHELCRHQLILKLALFNALNEKKIIVNISRPYKQIYMINFIKKYPKFAPFIPNINEIYEKSNSNFEIN